MIPNIIFSCATLPNIDKVNVIIERHEKKFKDHMFHHIDVHDELTNVLLYDDFGNILMPHTQFLSLDTMKSFIVYHGKKYN